MTSTSLLTPLSSRASLSSLSAPGKLLLLLCNAIPLFQIVAIAIVIWRLRSTPGLCAGTVLALVYLLPPLLCRITMFLLPIGRHTIPLGSRDFFVWWFTLNMQMLFCRFPFLEELLRVVPGCYSLWLRLWGARIGKLTYWAAGLRILDRPFLHIGDHVTFGAGVRINPHVMLLDAQGQMVLVLAPVTIGDRVSVGGYSLLVAGSEIAADQCTRACLMLPPFNRLVAGHREKPSNTPVAADE